MVMRCADHQPSALCSGWQKSFHRALKSTGALLASSWSTCWPSRRGTQSVKPWRPSSSTGQCRGESALTLVKLICCLGNHSLQCSVQCMSLPPMRIRCRKGKTVKHEWWQGARRLFLPTGADNFSIWRWMDAALPMMQTRDVARYDLCCMFIYYECQRHNSNHKWHSRYLPTQL